MTSSKSKRNFEDPVMSDLTILVSVEDLINMAMGPSEGNTINFKMIQSVLHILARQLRVLETKVEIKIADVGDMKKKKKKDSPESSESPKHEQMDEIDEEKTPRGSRKSKFREKDVTDPREKDKSPEKDSNEKDEKAEAKRKKSTKSSKQKQTTGDQDETEVKESSPKRSKSLKEKEQKLLEKMSPEEREKYKKQKEKEEMILKNMSSAEKEKYLKDKEKELNDLEQMSPKEREKYFKDKEKQLSALQQMSSPEKEKKLLEQMSPKEKELYLKQKEREDKALLKMSPKEKEKYFEEKAREMRALEGMSPKEREKYLKEKEEEAIALEKMSPKEREKYLKDKKKQIPKATSSGTSIAITEVERQKEKVLIVEKGPTTRASKPRVGSIEVVTVSRFNMLEAEVERLTQTAGPLPMPALPDDKKLKEDLVKGSASLTDTMQAMQVSARVQAAEAGLARIAGLLTQLAASGALPEGFAGQLEDAKAEMEALRSDLKGEAPASSKAYRKSVAISQSTKKLGRDEDGVSGMGMGTAGSPGQGTRPSSAGIDKRASVAVSVGSRYSRASTVGRPIAITRNEMDDAIQSLRDDMTRSMQTMTYRAASSAETAAGTAKGIADKMEIALNLNSRISNLYALTSDYAEQLSGFDAGLVTQMQSFQEQMAQMRGDLKSGLVQLDTANNNAETAAVLELTERYTELQNELEANILEHQRLAVTQKQLGDELRGLVEAVETLKEQKADRDEVWDGLRDKADLTRLAGLLTEDGFALSRAELENRLEVCYDKFNRQEMVWMTAMKDLTDVAMDKAEMMHLLSIKDDAQYQLRDLAEKLRLLTIQLGEPNAAILTRHLSKDGTCGACKVTAHMDAAEQRAGKPPELPALRPPPDGQPCEPNFTPIAIEDEEDKSHMCNRWVGGSHTLVSRSVPREVAPAQIAPLQPVKKYIGYGTDGKLYNMEEALQPCFECNKLTTDKAKEETGAGDTEPQYCDCLPEVEKGIQQNTE